MMKSCKCGHQVKIARKKCPKCSYKFKQDDKFFSKEEIVVKKYCSKIGAKQGDIITHCPSVDLSEIPEFQPEEGWVNEIIEMFLERKRILMPEAVVYIAARKYGYKSDTFMKIIEEASEVFDDFEVLDSRL